MDATASLVTLISLSKEIATKSRNVIRRYRNSSQALHRVRQHVLQLETQLFLLRDIQEFFAHERIHGEKEALTLQETLAQTHSTLSCVREFLSQHTEVAGSKARLRWAIRDEALVRQWVDDLQQLTHGLNSIILMLNIRLASDARIMAQAFQADLSTLIRERSIQPRKQKQDLRRSSRDENYQQLITTCPSTSRDMKESEDPGASPPLSSTIRFWAKFKSLCQILHGFLLYKQMSNRNQLIPESSQVFIACKAGNTMAVLTLFEARKASPFDRTPQNSTPLRYAIESGSLSLVQLLLDYGADPDASFGVHDTLPLAWAIAARKPNIVRFLVSRGADVHDVSLKGWTPIFYLFGGLEASNGCSKELEPCTEYLQLLAGASFQDFDTQDRVGWTSMHRAALHGTAEDMHALLDFHASPFLKTKRLQWPPIFMSIYYSNLATFKELAEMHPNYSQERDLRGWTALHVAAGAGNEEITSMVLKDGADVHARAEPTTYMVPESLRCREITPADVAWEAGMEQYLTYVRAVAANDTRVQIVDVGGVKEMFWQAVEDVGAAQERRT